MSLLLCDYKLKVGNFILLALPIIKYIYNCYESERI